jgi:hypothetical protein
VTELYMLMFSGETCGRHAATQRRSYYDDG